MAQLVHMKGIEKYFPGVHALKSVQFELVSGEVHALMGENGAGKSTLMKILAGIYQRDGGENLIEGVSANPSTPKEALDLGIAMIHQELSLMNDLTAAQNIFIGREPRNMFGVINEKELNRKTQELFDLMNLHLQPTEIVGNLTIAKQQMVEIAKALSYDSKVLIMDEPTAALNEEEVAELFVIINHLRDDNRGIVYISHKMDELKRIADRVTIMRDGSYIDTVDAKATPIKNIISMMVGREVSDEPIAIPDLSEKPVGLRVKGLTRGKEIRDVSFEVRMGEILGFAGLMGAGRTEVARAIFGADPIDSGEIYVHEKAVKINSPRDAVQNGIGYLSEDRKRFGLATGMDVRDNVALASLERFRNALGILNEKSMQTVAGEYIEKLGIRTPSDQQEVRLLSGGNQQKVVISKWLYRDCDILIFDEPTRGIDVGAKSEIYKLMENLAAQGKCIILISSELPEVMYMSHRIAVMCEGRLTGILPGGKSTTQEHVMTLATQRESIMEPMES